MSLRCLPCALVGALLLAGCQSPVRQNVNALLCSRANAVVDPQMPGLLGDAAGAPSAAASSAVQGAQGEDGGLRQVGAVEAPQPPDELPKPRPVPGKTLLKALQVPPNVPGANAPPIVLPPATKTAPAVMEKAVRKYFPQLPAVGPDPGPRAGPDGRPLTLTDLQKLARANSPLLRQAAADIQAYEGAVKQASLYPNPQVGLQGQTTGPGGGPIYGGFFAQLIKTGGKLKLATAAAEKDLENARLAYRKAETDLTAAVRTGYFAVLVAQENIKATRALVKLTDKVYDVMVRMVVGGEVATYEPMQLGVFAAQARVALIQGRNNYTLAWKQLAASMGLPAMPPTAVEGRVNMPIPAFHYDRVLARVLTNHTDVATAVNTMQKARYNLQTARVTPVPDVTMQAYIQEDASPLSPVSTARGIAVVSATLTLPVWDLNQGNIKQMQGALVRAVEESHRVRNDLSTRVADAYMRYDQNRVLLDLYRTDILPKQVQAFRGAVARHYGAGPAEGIAYNDLITAEQNLVSAIGPYLTVLGSMWQAVVDVANLLQTDDLFQTCERLPVAELPDLELLLQLPCCHPCNPLHGPYFRGADLLWPPAGFPPAPQADMPAPKTQPRQSGALGAPQGEAPPAGRTEVRIDVPAPETAQGPAATVPIGRVILLPPQSFAPAADRQPMR